MTMSANAPLSERAESPNAAKSPPVALLGLCAGLTAVGEVATLIGTGLWRAEPVAAAGPVLLLILAAAATVALARRKGAEQLARAFAERGDSEHEQIVIRVFLASIILVHGIVLLAMSPADEAAAATFFCMALGVAVAWLFLAHLMFHPGRTVWRRPATMLVDIGFLSLFLHVGGEAVAFWYPIYLWVTFGNGFRYGVPSLIACALLSVVCFALVIVTTPTWRQHPAISAGLLLALIVLPAYVSTLIRKLREAKAQAEKANAAKSRFLATMSHELRTPLNAMIGMGSVIRKTRLDADQQDMLRIIEDAARTLLSLINDVLDFSRMEAGQLRPETETFDLHEVVHSTLALLRPQASAKSLLLKQRIDPRLPFMVRGWPQQLRQVLTNLVANAIKFTETGQVSVRLDLATAENGGRRLRLVVADDGIGISADALCRLFQPFTQADGTVTRRFGGTGLGLAIVRQILDLMDGSVSVASTVGKGSVFTVDMPLDIDPAVRESTDLTGLGAVIVTEDGALAETLAGELKARGAEPNWARNLGFLPARPLQDAPRRERCVVIVDARQVDPAGTDAWPLLPGANAAGRPLVAIVRDRDQAEAVLDRAPVELICAITAPIEASELVRALRSVALPGQVPLGSADVDPLPEEQALREDEAAPLPRRRLRVLVAEDNPVNRKVLGRILSIAGHETRIVEDGEAALAALDDEAFDIALLDINMPRMSGYEVTKFYRMSRLGERRLPILALTADVTPETRRLCQEAGMDAVLTKPIDATRLIDAIQLIVEETMPEEDTANDLPEEATPISAHPHFTRQTAPIVREETLAALEALGGGTDFLTEVVETFRVDARNVMEKLAEAALSADASAFRDYAHSLRSSAANVGAARLCEALLTVRGITARELQRNGAAHLEMLRQNVVSLDQTLDKTLRGLAR